MFFIGINSLFTVPAGNGDEFICLVSIFCQEGIFAACCFEQGRDDFIAVDMLEFVSLVFLDENGDDADMKARIIA